MKLSVILTLYDVAREVPRTLRSLSRSNQHGVKDLAYDILLFDNGSPVLLWLLDEATWADVDVPAPLIRVEGALASPAGAINIAF